MVTTPEALLVELMKLDPAAHPIVPQILEVVRNYPIQIQTAIAESAKRSADPGFVSAGTIKAVADEQAVELQKMLEVFTAPAPDGLVVAWSHRDNPENFSPQDQVMNLRGQTNEKEFLAQHTGDFPPLAVEPAVIGSEPFKLAAEFKRQPDPGMGQWGSTPGLTAMDHDRAAAEEAHEPLIPAAIGQGSATSATDQGITVHGDAGDSGGAHSGSL